MDIERKKGAVPKRQRRWRKWQRQRERKKEKRIWRREKWSIEWNEVKVVRYKVRKEGKARQVLSDSSYNVGLRLKSVLQFSYNWMRKYSGEGEQGAVSVRQSVRHSWNITDGERAGTNKSHFQWFTSLVLPFFLLQRCTELHCGARWLGCDSEKVISGQSSCSEYSLHRAEKLITVSHIECYSESVHSFYTGVESFWTI